MNAPHANGIFLTVKDLMVLTGSNSYQSCARQHKAIRDSIVSDKRKLTIREYCDFEQISYDEVMDCLSENNRKN